MMLHLPSAMTQQMPINLKNTRTQKIHLRAKLEHSPENIEHSRDGIEIYS